LGFGESVLAAIAILAPSRAARNAIAKPMPRLAPEMKIVLPVSVGMPDHYISERGRPKRKTNKISLGLEVLNRPVAHALACCGELQFAGTLPISQSELDCERNSPLAPPTHRDASGIVDVPIFPLLRSRTITRSESALGLILKLRAYGMPLLTALS
jgi:hypothetical protein